MKSLAKKLITKVLAWQVRRLTKKRKFKVVAVAGSIGKTSTKFAIATILGQSKRVRFQAGNYNDLVSVPLVYFGLPMPSVTNPIAWARTFVAIEWQLRRPYPVDVVVVEVGTDFPGNIIQFDQYVHADIGVLTAITPEHMEYFGGLDAVAKEELSIRTLSDKMLVNRDLCSPKYLEDLLEATTYGVHRSADYKLQNLQPDTEGYDFTITKQGQKLLQERHASVAKTQLISITAGVAVADMMGLSTAAIRKGIEAIQPVSGRMQRLKGIQDTTILDDTYNASPEAVKAALDTIYAIDAPQKIALLGNMNELGNFSAEAHTEIGTYCDPKQLDLVVTLGPDANKYLAPAAEAAGCKVIKTKSPYQAATEIKRALKDGALILAKGSQNKVFAEEAVKELLADPADASKLVRQSKYWAKVKQKNFGA